MKNKFKKIVAALVATIIVGQSISASAVTITESATYTVQAFDKETAPFGEKLIAVKQKGKWGFMNLKGKMAIAATYQRTHNFSDGLAAVKKGGKWGFINKNNKFIIQPTYSAVFIEQFLNGYATVKKDGKWGMIDQKGKVILPFTYQEVGIQQEGLILVKVNNKYGFVNLKNEVVIEPIYNYALEFSNGLAGVVNDKGASGYINTSGEIVIDFNYTTVFNFDKERAVVQNESGLYGVIDKTGKVIVPFKYLSMTETEDSIVGYTFLKNEEEFSGYLNMQTGKKVFSVPATGWNISPLRGGGIFYLNNQTGNFNSVYTKTGKKIKLKNEYMYIMYFHENYALGAINKQGTKVKILHKK